jgi:hypothetical protein
MIRLIEHKDIDKERWDAVLEAAPNGNIFSYSWYLDALCDTWHALVRGDYEQVMPLPTAKKMGVQYVFQPFFSRELGVFGTAAPTDQEVAEFISAIPPAMKFIQVGFDLRPASTFKSFDVEEVAFQQVNFDLDLAGIRKRYSTNAKRNAKKAPKAGMYIAPLEDTKLIVELFKSNKGGQLGVFNDNDFSRLNTLMQNCLDRERGWGLGVYDEEGALHASAFFMLGQDCLVYLNGAADDLARKNGAMHYVIDYMIEQWHERVSRLDFGGSKVPSVAKFYHTFGSVDETYSFITKDRLPGLVKLVRKLKQQF